MIMFLDDKQPQKKRKKEKRDKIHNYNQSRSNDPESSPGRPI